MRSLWCNSFWVGIILFAGLYGAQGQVPFNIAIPDTFEASFGFDILCEDSALLISSFVDPDGTSEFVQRISKHMLDGTIVWQTIIANNATKSYSNTHCNNLIRTDNGYIILGNAKDSTYYFNPTLAFLDEEGKVQKMINLTDSLGSKPIIWTSSIKNDSVIILGCTRSSGSLGSTRPFFIEITYTGRVLNTQNLPFNSYRALVSMYFLDGKIFICGYRGETSGTEKDAWAAVLDTQYNILFETSLGEPNIFNSSESIVATPDGGFMVEYVADSTNYTGSWHSYFVKYDTAFQQEWIRKLPLSGRSLVRDISLLRDGSILFGGDFQDSINDPIKGLIGKINLQGEFQWMHAYQQNPTTRREYVKVAKELPSGHLIFTGYTFPDDPSGIITPDTWLFLTDSNGCIVPSECESLPLGVKTGMPAVGPLTLYPNPAGEFVHLSLPANELPDTYTVYNMTGTRVASGNVQSVFHTVDIKNLTHGLYLLVIHQDGNLLATGKFVKH